MWRPRSAPKVSAVRIFNFATSARNPATLLRIASTGLFDDLIIIIKMLTHQLKDEGGVEDLVVPIAGLAHKIMVAEHFTLIGEEDDDGVFEIDAAEEAGEEL